MALQAGEELTGRGKKCQGTTLVVPNKHKGKAGFSP